ncbi:MerR family transcriptional regulator [Variovorax sp. PCZ-1]|uniref:MerR family transcriptional regulator n=1 Tax=Variovorax sp. PCZ-1 TaxID=2835533 RepID=UPI001BCEAD7B|nr:MerR family transcriptional regulator [Variovorax sp. PCZ-1]
MNDRAAVRPITVSIAAVERDTGLSKDTLRVWERRYGFPMPLRDTYGERAYSLDQVEKLRVIKRLLDNGHRPGRVVAMSIEELQSIGESLSAAPQRITQADKTDLREYLALIKSHDVDGLRRLLGQSLMRMGIGSFVCNVVAPLNTTVGDAWMRGQIEVFEEHMYTESVNMVLRSAIGAAPDSAQLASPRVLLTTFPQEPHGMGLLMAEAMLSLEACRCVSLGTQTPIWDIVLAATAHKADIVALSFTASQNPNYVVNGLEELRSKLGTGIEIWAGGSCPIIHRRSIEGVKPIAALQDIAAQVANWRSQH